MLPQISEFSWFFFSLKVLMLFFVMTLMLQSVPLNVNSVKSDLFFYFKIF